MLEEVSSTHHPLLSPSHNHKKSLNFIAMDVDRLQSIETGLCNQRG
jgi:hypothetical protein